MTDIVRHSDTNALHNAPRFVAASDLGSPRPRWGMLRGLGTHQAAAYLMLVVVPVGAVIILLRSTSLTAVPGGTPDGRSASHHAVLGSLLLAIATVVLLTRALGMAAVKLRQPQVMGEMAAGLLLGPSLLGAVLPGAHAWLFPAEVIPMLDHLGQLAVIFFMFLVGLELPLEQLRRCGRAVLTLGHASTAVPFVGGVVLALTMLERYRPAGADGLAFVLFCGLATSVTAFPVLARILAERGIHRTALGTLGLSGAGIADVTAWCLLALVISETRGGSSVLAVSRTLLFTVLFVLVMAFAVRPMLAGLLRREKAGRSEGSSAVALLALVMLSSWVTDALGIHAIFGAFLAGVIMPRSPAPVHRLADRLEGLATSMLLPLFFAVVGLKTALGELGDPDLLTAGIVLIVVAMATKVLGTAAAARLTGLPGRQSWGLGVMMSCRGLTELVILEVGRSLGVIGPELFGIFVLMALITTALTGPFLDLLRVAPSPTPERGH